jgi:hypothetical protein
VDFQKLHNIKIEVTSKQLQESRPDKQFVRIRKMNGDGSETLLSLTPAEGEFIYRELGKMAPLQKPLKKQMGFAGGSTLIH